MDRHCQSSCCYHNWKPNSLCQWCIGDGIVEVGDNVCIVPAGVGVQGDGERCIHGWCGTPPAIPPSQHHLLIVTINCFTSILVHNICFHSKYILNSRSGKQDNVLPKGEHCTQWTVKNHLSKSSCVLSWLKI